MSFFFTRPKLFSHTKIALDAAFKKWKNVHIPSFLEQCFILCCSQDTEENSSSPFHYLGVYNYYLHYFSFPPKLGVNIHIITSSSCILNYYISLLILFKLALHSQPFNISHTTTHSSPLSKLLQIGVCMYSIAELLYPRIVMEEDPSIPAKSKSAYNYAFFDL